MPRTLLSAVLIASALHLQVDTQSVEHPATLLTENNVSLPRAGQAARARLLGQQPIYSVAVYVAGSLSDRDHLASPDVPKILRIATTEEEDLYRRVVLDWRQELVPPLEPAEATHLRGAFASLRGGDLVVVEYVPNKGTAVRVNKAVAVPSAGHDLILAFLNHWLGQRPVSEEMKRALLGT